MRVILARLVAASLLGGGLLGCDAVEEALNEALKGQRTGPRKLSDEDAFKYLKKDPTAAPATDVDAVLKVIDGEVAAETGEKQTADLSSPDVVALMRKVARNRLTIDEKAFNTRTDFFQEFAPGAPKGRCDEKWGPADVQALPNEKFLIPQVDKVPVRNQGYRGTCAAFTGVGALEYAVLNPLDANGGNPDLPTLDLSEQAFYFNSKPECQSGGCECPGCAEGSWYGVGFDDSADKDTPNLPLEADCAYNDRPGRNDTQRPLANTCNKGAVKVEATDHWCGITEIVRFLHAGYAVPFASPLDDAWERNNGLITKKGHVGAGNTVHAGGHAYLIVGYKKLPNMPEEGGLCFIIKNSWGTGWGVNGYSCMTVAWMQTVKFDGFFGYLQPVPMSVALRDDLRQAQSLPEPEPVPEPDPIDETVVDDEVVADEEEVLPPLPPDTDPEPTPAPDPDDGAGGGGEPPAPKPEPPEPAPEKFRDAKLLGPNESYYVVKVAPEGNELRIKGLVRAGEETRQLRVIKQGDHLVYKGDVVGRYKNDELVLCTGEWGTLCSLRYKAADKLMYIQFRDEDLRAVQASETSPEKGSWVEMPLADRPLGIFVPSDAASLEFLANPKTFVKLGSGAPARFSLAQSGNKALGDLTKFDLKLQGLQVGKLDVLKPTEASLCDKEFEDTCTIFGGDQLHMIPSNKRRK